MFTVHEPVGLQKHITESNWFKFNDIHVAWHVAKNRLSWEKAHTLVGMPTQVFSSICIAVFESYFEIEQMFIRSG